MNNKIFLPILLGLFLITFISAESMTYGKPTDSINYGANYTINVNNTIYHQGYTVLSLRSFFETYFNGIYCKLTGCEMTGNITTTGNITANYFIGNGSLLTDIAGGAYDDSWMNGTYVPYTGANQNVNLGNNNLSVNGTTLFVNTNNSRVGIGTINASTLFDVYGSARIGQSIKTPNKTLDLSGHINFNTVSPPTSSETAGITLTEGTGGTLAAGRYFYSVLYYTIDGDTTSLYYTSAPNITVSANARVTLGNIPVSSDPRVIGRRVYRSSKDGTVYTQYKIGSIANNVDTTFIDTGFALGTDWIYYKPDETAGRIYIDNFKAMMITDTTVSLGTSALGSVTAYGNTGIGAKAGNALTTGLINTFIGQQAGYSMIGGNANTAIGVNTMMSVSAGNNNIAIGSDTLRQSVTQTLNNNIALGIESLSYGTGNRDNNIGIGSYSGRYANGTGNIFLGFYAGRHEAASLIGDSNIVIGSFAGRLLGSGNNNTLIGTNVELNSNSSSNQLNIGNLIYGFGMLGGSTASPNGNISIGTNNALAKLHVNGSILANGTINATGGFGVNGKSGITGNYTILKDADLIALTKTYCFFNITGGLITGTNC